jgi:hypothetical protein
LGVRPWKNTSMSLSPKPELLSCIVLLLLLLPVWESFCRVLQG